MKHKHHKRRRHPKIQRRTQPGSSPGVIQPEPESARPVVTALCYGPAGVDERTIADLGEIPKLLADHAVTWINVEGLGDAQVIERLGQLFGLHRLALEDVVNLHQRAKVEEYEGALFVVVRMADFDGRAETEQLSLFLGSCWVLTFQEGRPGDSFNRVRERIRANSGRIRSAGADYLAYALIDAVIDAYFPVLEIYSDRLDELEDAVVLAPSRELMGQIHEVKSDLLLLRRAIWPQREAVAQLARESTAGISETTRLYLRDCYDHVVQIVELVETYRELTADLRDLYMSAISNRINETMRVLTIISTLFIPLTFIAGVYGMNFDYDAELRPLNMPELYWKYGYVVCLTVMALTTLAMMYYFYRQGWILQRLRARPERETPAQ